MSIPINKLLPKVKRYFRCLWAALRGHDRYRDERNQLYFAVKDSAKGLQQLKELYNSALDKWKHDSETVLQQEKVIAKLQTDIFGYQNVIENLRSRVMEKEKENDDLRQQYQGLLDKQN